MTTYFLVDGQETDVGLFHGEEEHERAAGVADARGAATAVHEGAANTGRGRGHVTARAGPGAAGRPGLPVARLGPPALPLTGAEPEGLARCKPGRIP